MFNETFASVVIQNQKRHATIIILMIELLSSYIPEFAVIHVRTDEIFV